MPVPTARRADYCMARAFAETAYGIAPRAALLARRFHDAARTQQVLNAHRRVARAVVRPGSAVGAVTITVLPRQSATEPRPMQSEDLVALVAERGFTGTVEACELVREEETLPVVRHERYVLIDLLRAIFVEADANADGMITMPELAGFLSRHGLEGATGCISVLVENGPEHKLDFGEFKARFADPRSAELIGGSTTMPLMVTSHASPLLGAAAAHQTRRPAGQLGLRGS